MPHRSKTVAAGEIVSHNEQYSKMKISKELTPIAYDLSKKVFEGKLTFKEGQCQLVGDNRMNPNSAADYINNLRCMVEGKRFSRTNNAYSIEYFIDNIYKDYGSNGLSNALTALQLHIEYYENIQKVVMRKMRDIHAKYLAIPMDTLEEQEQREIIREFKAQNKTKQEIIEELKKLQPTDHEEVIINNRSYKRDNRTIAQLKILRDFKCQICSTTIKKKDGTFYVEAAHIRAKHKKGRETPDNILLLCPNHHKEFDLGDRNIFLHDKDKIYFTLNGQEYKIPLKIE
jgi:Predicted restriction endonuclease